MKKLPNVSDAEWNVMKVLWEKSPQTSAEIISKIGDTQSWSPKTVHTLISRLVKKGAVDVKKDKACYLYSAVVSQEELVANETSTFINRVFDGSMNSLIAHFAKEKKLTKSELEELKRILNEKK